MDFVALVLIFLTFFTGLPTFPALLSTINSDMVPVSGSLKRSLLLIFDTITDVGVMEKIARAGIVCWVLKVECVSWSESEVWKNQLNLRRMTIIVIYCCSLQNLLKIIILFNIITVRTIMIFVQSKHTSGIISGVTEGNFDYARILVHIM